jgi:hypothetical protein
MKRNEIVEKLIKEGFSEKTLVKFTDKQLTELSERLLGEQNKGSVVMKKATTPPAEVKKMTDQGLNVELREKELTDKQKKNIDKNKNGKIDKQDFIMLLKGKKGEKRCEDCDKPHKDCTCNKDYMGEEINETKNWVKNLVEKKEFHSFTSKNEIMELIEMKLSETEMVTQHGPKVKKGHNGIPEFMSYDAIVAAAEPKTEPSTKPAPTKDPGTKTPPKKDPRKTPFKPGPGPNPKPKALKETE